MVAVTRAGAGGVSLINYRPPSEEILDVIENVVGFDSFLSSSEFPNLDNATVRQVIEACSVLVSKEIAPRAAAMDREGCGLVDGRVRLPAGFLPIWQALREGGWISLSIAREHGGLDFPHLVQAGVSEMICGANIAVSMIPLLIRGAVKLIGAYAGDRLKSDYLERLVTGEWAATICVTEPHAGSDVAAITTHARLGDDGMWRITGDKIFISFGDHDLTEGIVHIVLARTHDGTNGSREIGLFAVPVSHRAGRDARVSVLAIEHKLGLNASPTCAVNFDRATAYPLGPTDQGLNTIFAMINEMRLEVAVQGVAVSHASLQAASDYAKSRVQGWKGASRVTISEHPDVKRTLLTARSLASAGRALVYQAAALVDLSTRGRSGHKRRKAGAMASFLLPLCKAGCAESAVENANAAIQVHGGHGYIKDLGVERLLRDARILPIYEGTTGIQALDFTFRKLLLDDGMVFSRFCEWVRSDAADARRDGVESDVVGAVIEAIEIGEKAAVVMRGYIANARTSAMAHATIFLRLMYRVCLLWSSLRLARFSKLDPDTNRLCARFASDQMLPELRGLLAQLQKSPSYWESAPSAAL